MMRPLTIANKITTRNVDSLDKFLIELRKYPVITTDQEVELFTRLKDGDTSVKDLLINSNLRFVVSVAKQYNSRNVQLGDLINEGMIGLIKAVERYDVTKGYKFISYAVWWIRQSILEFLSKHQRTIKLPNNRINDNIRMVKYINEFYQEHGYECSAHDIEQDLGIEKDIIHALMTNTDITASLSNTINSKEDSGSLIDVLVNENSISPDKFVEEEYEKYQINTLLKRLNDRERFVIEHYFGINGKMQMNYGSIGEILNTTSETARLITNKALMKMKSRNFRFKK